MNHMYNILKELAANFKFCLKGNEPILIKQLNGISFAQKGQMQFFRMLCIFTLMVSSAMAQGPLTVLSDPLCSTNCCSPAQPCNCSAGIKITGGLPPYSILVLTPGGPVINSTCVSGLCPGTYVFSVRDANNVTVQCPVTVGQSCCHLNCRDTSFCFGLPDSMIVLLPPTYTDTSTGSGGTGPGGPPADCVFDSMWNNSPGIFPVGTTVVKWYVRQPNGSIDSCSQNVIRNPPTPYAIIFNICPLKLKPFWMCIAIGISQIVFIQFV